MTMISTANYPPPSEEELLSQAYFSLLCERTSWINMRLCFPSCLSQWPGHGAQTAGESPTSILASTSIFTHSNLAGDHQPTMNLVLFAMIMNEDREVIGQANNVSLSHTFPKVPHSWMCHAAVALAILKYLWVTMRAPPDFTFPLLRLTTRSKCKEHGLGALCYLFWKNRRLTELESQWRVVCCAKRKCTRNFFTSNTVRSKINSNWVK